MAVTDDAILRIKAMIVQGDLRPGDRLPREADLADRLGLSRNSLREAVRALSLVGVLDVRRGDGTYVTSLDAALLMGAMEFIVDLHRDDTVRHLVQVRRMLEPAATALAAARIGDDDLAALERDLRAVGPDTGAEELVAADLAFHRRIAAASGNPVLASVLDGLSAPTQRARVWRGLTEAGAVERTVAEHRGIWLALRDRDPEAARTRALLHVAGTEAWVGDAMEGVVDGSSPTSTDPASGSG
ncbi:FadR/GntR family transcriptional regulator [Phycicoccus flavus]|uniref:FadR/GntR family transcriptional regulator n=1 Tax=Phycicoccus flavus TaxID=2502783 RepID=UPI000FEBE0C8|nr:FadR/GntR family transcriptional regulator [Phycicoccus flavus]NHA66445.1 FadR family transcriptional regulator [Phycicoccus flavus]